MSDVIEIPRPEVLVVATKPPAAELIETAVQGLPGPPGTVSFDDDIALIYQIAKL